MSVDSRCITKTSYTTLAFAEEHLKIIKEKKNDRVSCPVRAYKCEWCHNYHLTSKVSEKSRRDLSVELKEVKDLLKRRESEVFKLREIIKSHDSKPVGTNALQIKIRLLEKEVEKWKLKAGSKGSTKAEIGDDILKYPVEFKDSFRPRGENPSIH